MHFKRKHRTAICYCFYVSPCSAPTLLLTRTTCDGTSLINCFGSDCWSNPTIVLVNGKSHRPFLFSCLLLSSSSSSFGGWQGWGLSPLLLSRFHFMRKFFKSNCYMSAHRIIRLPQEWNCLWFCLNNFPNNPFAAPCKKKETIGLHYRSIGIMGIGYKQMLITDWEDRAFPCYFNCI